LLIVCNDDEIINYFIKLLDVWILNPRIKDYSQERLIHTSKLITMFLNCCRYELETDGKDIILDGITEYKHLVKSTLNQKIDDIQSEKGTEYNKNLFDGEEEDEEEDED